ncbi:MAG: class I SAM-dependent methyltransferase [Bacteroidetes bacterium]|jgi:23S rRNA (cytosine1962-C5)-methyltransferase|nr:class I SAM-dependent methyltransferase [Bacteroidota bacterium]
MAKWLLEEPRYFADYELLDSGGFEKLERFGQQVLIRPEPQAVWQPHGARKDWDRLAHLRFEQQGSHKGKWHPLKKGVAEQWQLAYTHPQYQLRFRLGLTAFKHVGLFPEQAANWDYAYAQCRKHTQPRVLNLFAYTGGATLACQAAGAQVTHVDSVKQVVSWANENLRLSKLDGVRWLVEDALKYVQRAARKGQTYEGIIMDPPAFGHGPNGERWKLEDLVDELVQHATRMLNPDRAFMVFNAYSMGFSPLILGNLLQSHLPAHKLGELALGELVLPETAGKRQLPAGIFARLHYGHPEHAKAGSGKNAPQQQG